MLSNSFHSMHFLHYDGHQGPRTEPTPGNVIPIIGIYADDHGHRCIEHICCGQQVQLNVVLFFAGNRSASHEGKKQLCAATSWLMALISGMLDLKCYCTKFDNYNGVLILMVDVIAPDDADITRWVKFHHFYGWADVAIIGVIEHCPSSGDEQHLRKKKIIKYNLENK